MEPRDQDAGILAVPSLGLGRSYAQRQPTYSSSRLYSHMHVQAQNRQTARPTSTYLPDGVRLRLLSRNLGSFTPRLSRSLRPNRHADAQDSPLAARKKLPHYFLKNKRKPGHLR